MTNSLIAGGAVLAFVIIALVIKTFRKHKIPAKPPGPVYPKQPQK